MVFCRKCGTEIKTGVKFCPKCGTKIDDFNPVKSSSVVPVKSSPRHIEVKTEVLPPEPDPIIPIVIASPPKKRRYGTIVAAVFVVAIVVVAAFFLMAPAKYDIELSTDGHGTVSGAGSYDDGDRVSITASPSYGYVFSYWTSNGIKISNNQTYSFIIHDNVNYVAHFEPRSFNVRITSNDSSWGSYSGSGIFKYQTSATLTASPNYGFEFLGWYNGSTFCSSSASYRPQVTADVTYTAKFGIIHDATFSCSQDAVYAPVNFTFMSKYDVEIASSKWTLSEKYGGSSIATYNAATKLIHTSPEQSCFIITRTVTYTDGVSSTYSSECLADSIYTRTVDFRYSNGDWWSSLWGGYSNVSTSITFDIKWSDYLHYSHLDLNSRSGRISQSFIDKFIIPEDTVIQQIANYVRTNTSGLSELQRAQYALNMVQMMISYEYDEDRKGRSEYFGYAVETLYEGKGDCDDSAIVYANIMKALGYKTAMGILYYSDGGHACAMIVCEGASGYYYEYNGMKYYFAEATDDTAGNTLFRARDIGSKPNGFSSWESTKFYFYPV